MTSAKKRVSYLNRKVAQGIGGQGPLRVRRPYAAYYEIFSTFPCVIFVYHVLLISIFGPFTRTVSFKFIVTVVSSSYYVDEWVEQITQ